jgi:RNA polymerase-binding transcription factor DksA
MPVPTAGAEGLNDKDLRELEEHLLQERRKIMKDMGHLENTVLKVNQRDSSGDLSGYSFHMADAGTDAMEREKAFLFASAEGRLLLEVNDALRRLYNGTYGICELCEKPIARARLDAMPYTRLCVSCKEKEEKLGRSAPSPEQ